MISILFTIVSISFSAEIIQLSNFGTTCFSEDKTSGGQIISSAAFLEDVKKSESAPTLTRYLTSDLNETVGKCKEHGIEGFALVVTMEQLKEILKTGRVAIKSEDYMQGVTWFKSIQSGDLGQSIKIYDPTSQDSRGNLKTYSAGNSIVLVFDASLFAVHEFLEDQPRAWPFLRSQNLLDESEPDKNQAYTDLKVFSQQSPESGYIGITGSVPTWAIKSIVAADDSQKIKEELNATLGMDNALPVYTGFTYPKEKTSNRLAIPYELIKPGSPAGVFGIAEPFTEGEIINLHLTDRIENKTEVSSQFLDYSFWIQFIGSKFYLTNKNGYEWIGRLWDIENAGLQSIRLTTENEETGKTQYFDLEGAQEFQLAEYVPNTGKQRPLTRAQLADPATEEMLRNYRSKPENQLRTLVLPPE